MSSDREIRTHGGKGSAPRKQANYAAFAENYDKIFEKKGNKKRDKVVARLEKEAEEFDMSNDDYSIEP